MRFDISLSPSTYFSMLGKKCQIPIARRFSNRLRMFATYLPAVERRWTHSR